MARPAHITQRPKVLLAKPGLDSHWRGVIVLARALADAGIEVIYLGNQTPEAIAVAAVEEDVDLVGLSIMSGAHLRLAPKVIVEMHARGVDDVPVIVGGAIPPREIEKLMLSGITAVFPVGTSIAQVLEWIDSRFGEVGQAI